MCVCATAGQVINHMLFILLCVKSLELWGRDLIIIPYPVPLFYIVILSVIKIITAAWD